MTLVGAQTEQDATTWSPSDVEDAESAASYTDSGTPSWVESEVTDDDDDYASEDDASDESYSGAGCNFVIMYLRIKAGLCQPCAQFIYEADDEATPPDCHCGEPHDCPDCGAADCCSSFRPPPDEARLPIVQDFFDRRRRAHDPTARPQARVRSTPKPSVMCAQCGAAPKPGQSCVRPGEL